MLRAIVIDDEEAAIKLIGTFARRYPEQVRIVASATNALDGIELIGAYKPDVVFLDISMPGMNGFELLRNIPDQSFKLVFITAHEQYAIPAIKHRASDYLLKPIDSIDFKACIDGLTTLHEQQPSPEKHEQHLRIGISVKDGIVYLKQNEIVRIEASGSYTYFYMDDGTRHIASKRIGDFENKLDQSLFFRCHKSHIINLDKVQKFISNDGFFALMTDGSMPDISRTCKDIILQRLGL